MNNIKTVNIPLKTEFDRDITALRKRKRNDNICKYSLVFVAVVGVILTGILMVG